MTRDVQKQQSDEFRQTGVRRGYGPITRGCVLVLAAFLDFGCAQPVAASAQERSDMLRVEGNVIHISQTFARRIDLKSVEVKASGVIPTIAVVGTVTLDPEHTAHVGTRLRGLVHELHHYEGDVVRKGEILAFIDSPELGEAQSAVVSLRAASAAARLNSSREVRLAQEKLTTPMKVEKAASAADKYQALLDAAMHRVATLAGTPDAIRSRALGMHAITAPIAGTLVERHITKGQLFAGDHTAFVVTDLDYLWIELAVFERSLPLIRLGDEVRLQPLGSHAQAITGRVSYVGEVLNSATRSAPVRVRVDNRNRQLRPGQAVDATIHATEATLIEGLSVPPDAVTFVDGKPTVFVLERPERIRVVPVELGESDVDEQHVKHGLKAGELVVTNGAFELKRELFR